LACSLCLASCTNPNGTVNNQQTDSLIGGGGGAAAGGILGNILGHGSAAGTLIGAAAGGALGYFAGSYIGSKLDERDQRVAAQNTTDILDEPVYEPPPGHATVIHHNPPVRHWTSDHSGATGSATVTKVAVSTTGEECKEVRQIAVINGQELHENQNYCRNADGGWKPVAA
jgi:surface antigen